MAARRGLFAVLLICLSALLIGRSVPPFQSPDEFDHIERAALVAAGQPFLSTQAETASGGAIDTGLLEFMSKFSDLPHQPDVTVSPETKAAAAEIGWSGETRFETLPGTGYYFPLIYLPQAAGLWTGQTLGLTVADSYLLTRIFTLIAGLTFLGVAFSLIQPSALLLAIFALPMMLFQAASATIDFTSTSALVLVLALFLTSMSDASRPSMGRLLALGFFILLVAGCRLQLAPLVLLPLAISVKFRDLRSLAITVVLTISILAWYGFALGATVDTRVDTGTPTNEIVFYYASNPIAFFKVVLTTLSDEYFRLRYWHSFLGILGWLDVFFTVGQYRLLGTLFLAIAFVSLFLRQVSRDPLTVFTLITVAFSSILLIFLSLLVTWTPHPADVVHGVQGRYFLPSVVVLAGLITPAFKSDEASSIGFLLENALLLLLLIFSVYLVNHAVIDRYFSPELL